MCTLWGFSEQRLEESGQGDRYLSLSWKQYQVACGGVPSPSHSWGRGQFCKGRTFIHLQKSKPAACGTEPLSWQWPRL